MWGWGKGRGLLKPGTASSDSREEEKTAQLEGVHWYRVAVLFRGRVASRT